MRVTSVFLLAIVLAVILGLAVAQPTTAEDCSHAVPCNCGWSLFSDFRGREGHDSCVKFFPAISGSAQPWEDSQAVCVSNGGHLLTFAMGKMGLPEFAADLIPLDAGKAFVGCTQLTTATKAGRDWSWVDGTDDTNLNCGPEEYAEIGKTGCGAWTLGEPNDYNMGGEFGNERYCELYSSRYAPFEGLNDWRDQFESGSVGPLKTGGFLCEKDLSPSPTPTTSPTPSKSVTPSKSASKSRTPSRSLTSSASVTRTPTKSKTPSRTPSTSVCVSTAPAPDVPPTLRGSGAFDAPPSGQQDFGSATGSDVAAGEDTSA